MSIFQTSIDNSSNSDPGDNFRGQYASKLRRDLELHSGEFSSAPGGHAAGVRKGAADFFEALHANKQFLTLDLHTSVGQQKLRKLIASVDIVIERSRPRALRQMGIFAEALVENSAGLTWLSITGYGRQQPRGNSIAYGDDAGIAAGLSAIMFESTGEWVICGDAIADPSTGMHAALVAWASWQSGGGLLIDISLRQTLRHCIDQTQPVNGSYSQRQKSWTEYLHRLQAGGTGDSVSKQIT